MNLSAVGIRLCISTTSTPPIRGRGVGASHANPSTPIQLKEFLDHESNGLQHNIDALAARVTDLEETLVDDLRKEFNEAIDSQKLDLQVKMEDAVEQRLADVEEIVKQDVRSALENGKTTFNFEFGWADTQSQRGR